MDDSGRAPHPQRAVSGYAGQDLEALSDLPRYYRWVVASFGPNLAGRAFEVGAGIGNFSIHMIPVVMEAVLSEPDGALFERLKARFANVASVRTVRGTADTIALDPSNVASFDCVVAVNVLEHIAEDAAALRAWATLVRPGGAVLLFVPAQPWLFGSLDRLVGHHRRYTRRSLKRVVCDAGLDVVRIRNFDLLGVMPWLVVGRLLKMQTFTTGGAELYDRLVVPLMSPIEAALEPPVGKNLVCIARKRSP